MTDDVPQPAVPELGDPFDELHEMDLRVELAGLDDDDRAFDPEKHPKDPKKKEEPTTDHEGREVPIEDELGMFFEQEVGEIEDVVLDEEL